MNELTNTYKVFLKINQDGLVTAVNSDAFLSDTDGWTEIDEGEGDAFHHAQGNYLDKPLMTMQGIYQYKLVEGEIQERTAEEIQADIALIPPPLPTQDEVMEELLALLIQQGVITNVYTIRIPHPKGADHQRSTGDRKTGHHELFRTGTA